VHDTHTHIHSAIFGHTHRAPRQAHVTQQSNSNRHIDWSPLWFRVPPPSPQSPPCYSTTMMHSHFDHILLLRPYTIKTCQTGYLLNLQHTRSDIARYTGLYYRHPYMLQSRRLRPTTNAHTLRQVTSYIIHYYACSYMWHWLGLWPTCNTHVHVLGHVLHTDTIYSAQTAQAMSAMTHTRLRLWHKDD
jgi:hypothetical protein